MQASHAAIGFLCASLAGVALLVCSAFGVTKIAEALLGTVQSSSTLAALVKQAKEYVAPGLGRTHTHTHCMHSSHSRCVYWCTLFLSPCILGTRCVCVCVWCRYVDEELAFAVGVFFGAPLFAASLCLAFLNQSVRKLVACVCGPAMPEYERGLLVTSLAHRQLASLAERPWASILLKVYTIGLLAWVLLYGSTLTYMGLALLIAWLKTLHWLASSLIFFAVGIGMFLLPPVPGLAVYLCAGVLLTPACEPAFGYTNACLYSASLAFLMKLVAQILQQKGIGEALGGNVQVRVTIGVNTDLIKAIRHILAQPGVTLAKVSILCGGPDWPTAVLCGVLRLRLLPCLAGLMPIVLLTVPTSLAGAFQLRAAEGGDWESWSATMLGVAALVQLILGVLALYYIEQVKSTVPEALAVEDAEVAALSAAEERARAEFLAATQLAVLPRAPKAALLGGTSVLVLSAYLLVFFSGACFEEFALTDDVTEKLCLACDTAPVKPLGVVALVMLGFAISCLCVFNRWDSRRRVLATTTSGGGGGGGAASDLL